MSTMRDVHRPSPASTHVVEVAAEQAVLTSRPVTRNHLDVVAAQQGNRQQAALEPGVLAGSRLTRLQGSRIVLGTLALDGVPDRARQQVAVDPALDQVVLRAGRHGRESRSVLGETGHHHYGRTVRVR